MPFKPQTIVIYSVGLLGGSLGLALKNSGFNGKVIGLSSASNIETALKLGCIDEGFHYDCLQEVIAGADLLLLCSPIGAILNTIDLLGKVVLPQNLVISDVGSTKQAILCAAQQLPSHVHFIGGHPMAGSEKSGPGASDPYLFQNAIYVITPASGIPEEKERDFAAFLEKYLGCRTLFLDSAIHDRIAAAVSHVPHLLAVALVCLAQETEKKIPGTLNLAAGGFRDMTRIASASHKMWHDILSTNKDAIEPLLDSLINILSDIKQTMHDGTLAGYYQLSGDIRARIPHSNKGFLRQLSEVLVLAKDQPGFIATLSSLLFQKNINIKDIEVLKVREGEGGTIRLAFDTADIAREAISVLVKNGFSARERT